MLDGTWKPQAAELAGEAIPFPDSRLVITGERYVIETGGEREEGSLRVNQAASPHHLDLMGTKGSHAGQHIAALFRLRGNLLQLSYHVGGSSQSSPVRPRSLTPAPGSMQLSIRYRREA